jgi:hypothetical protein
MHIARIHVCPLLPSILPTMNPTQPPFLITNATEKANRAHGILEEYDVYAAYVVSAYAKLKERREQGIRDSALESSMYKRYYGPGTTTNTM